ncbi:hypothetical protein BBJ28_00024536 [Nothophytophthora sp. Chile5]|nr:hypothetical protein BBJ28_00024536 [Nothophytophthora sp. Chile5]
MALLFRLLLLFSIATAPISALIDATESIFDSSNGIIAGGGILAAGAIISGSTACIFGFKHFKSTLFSLGVVGGGTVVAIALERILEGKSWTINLAFVGFVAGGLLVGGLLVTSLYSPLGTFFPGIVAGVMLAIVFNLSFAYRIYPSKPLIVLLALAVVFAAACGIATVKLRKRALIPAFSWSGAFLFIWGIGYFVGNYPSFSDLQRYETFDEISGKSTGIAIPNAWWGYLAGTLVLFVLSAVLQFHTTRDVGDGDELLPPRRATGEPGTPSADEKGGAPVVDVLDTVASPTAAPSGGNSTGYRDVATPSSAYV